MNKLMKTRITWIEVRELRISRKENLSEGALGVTAGLSSSRRSCMSCFSCRVRNLESRGVEGTRKKLVTPTRKEKSPSCCECECAIDTRERKKKANTKQEEDDNGVHTRIKIHAQPGRPPIPSIFWIAAAKRPEKTPES